MFLNIRLSALAFILLFASGHTFGQALHRTIRVDPSGIYDKTTIAAALTQIGTDPPDKWTVLIYPGTYNENVDLHAGQSKNVDIVGIDRDAVIIAPSTGDGIKCDQRSAGGNNSIRNLTVKPAAGHGILIGDDTTISNVVVEAMGTDKNGIVTGSYDRLRVENCKVTAQFKAFDGTSSNSTDIFVSGSEFRSMGRGGAGHGTVYLGIPYNVLFKDCLIINDGSANSSLNPIAVLLDGSTNVLRNITFLNCKIQAIGAGTSRTVAVQNDATNDLKLINCEIIATATNATDAGAGAVGVRHGAIIMGGTIQTSAVSPKATGVWDIEQPTSFELFVSNITASKWYGPIKSASGKKSYVQRTLSIAAASTTAIHTGYVVGGSESSPQTPTTQPGVYRALTVSASAALTGNVYIKGKDWADNVIVDVIALNGTTTVTGQKPFKEVTSIIFPAGLGQTVYVGTANVFGLQVPIESASDVIQESRKASGASSYSIELTSSVNSTYGTVSTTITAGDSLEWVILTGK